MQRCGRNLMRRLSFRVSCLQSLGNHAPELEQDDGICRFVGNRRVAWLSAIALVGLGLGEMPAISQEELTDATVNRLRNQVIVELSGEPAKDAVDGDRLATVGDRLGTGAASQAQLIFNDDSLVRIGQNSLFSFEPGRRFILDDGVAAIVTPPGAGGAILNTPAAVAAVQGSFIAVSSREDASGRRVETFLNFNASPLELSDLSGQSIATLIPGQVALVVDGVLVKIAEFDPVQALNSFPLLAELCQDAPSGECERVTLASASEDVQREFWQSLLDDPSNRLENFGDFQFEPEGRDNFDNTPPPQTNAPPYQQPADPQPFNTQPGDPRTVDPQTVDPQTVDPQPVEPGDPVTPVTPGIEPGTAPTGPP